MKTLTFLLVLCLSSVSLQAGEDFIRNLPDKRLADQLTPDKFPNADAIIILKEQSLNVIEYTPGLQTGNAGTMQTKIVIAKLFNEAAVRRYGSFEYTYRELLGDRHRNGFEARARVMKPDGSVEEMDEDLISNTVAAEGHHGRPIARKVMFTIPNLAPGDIVQIEYTFHNRAVYQLGGVFYYSDRDPVLYSNLAITLPRDLEARYYSFPAQNIGEPAVQQISAAYGAGETRFWSLRNLPGIPSEPFAPTFEEQSLMTAFLSGSSGTLGSMKYNEWNMLAQEFCASFLEKNKVTAEEIALLHVAKPDSVTRTNVDELYAAIRRHFTLPGANALYPLSEEVPLLFEEKKGDASDQAYIFHNILKQWGCPADIVWVRDRRSGGYESSVPSMIWFDRMAVLVGTGKEQRLYDFDRAIPCLYQTPWFDNGIEVAVVTKDGCAFRTISETPQAAERYIREQHRVTFTTDLKMKDSVLYDCTGATAGEFREGSYALTTDALRESVRTFALKNLLLEADTVGWNHFLEDPRVQLTFSGTARSQPSHVDSFFIVRLNNHALAHLKGNFTSRTRRHPLTFPEPFTVSMEWQVALPHGYTVRTAPGPVHQKGANDLVADFTVKQESGTLMLKATLTIPSPRFTREDYRDLLSALEGLSTAIGQEIVLQKRQQL